MLVRFGKSKLLGKGVRLNLFKKSAGLSFGGRGASVGNSVNAHFTEVV